MDNHPIPQDVTGFQFKLIGSMTLKQFGYIAVGGVLAFIFFLNVKNFLIKWPLVLLFGGTGAALAFLPFEGRPLDLMVVNFFKALFAPTQYMYQKMGGHLAISMINLHPVVKSKTPIIQQKAGQHHSQQEMKKNQQLQAYLSNVQHQPTNELDKKEQERLNAFNSYSTTPQLTQQIVSQTSGVMSQGLGVMGQQPVTQAVVSPKGVVVGSQGSGVMGQTTTSAPLAPSVVAPAIPVATAIIAPVSPIALTPVAPVLPAPAIVREQATTQSQLKDIVSQKKQLESELLNLKQELALHRQQSAPQAVVGLQSPIVTSQESGVMSQTVASAPIAPFPVAPPSPAPVAPLVAAPVAPTPVAPAAPVVVAPIAPTSRPSPIMEGLASAATPAARTSRPTTFARKLTTSGATSEGLPQVSDSPNIIAGIVKDPRGNALANLLLEIKDKDGNPIRAFKTNLLGQFASATPLSNGIYTIEFEDPKGQHTFNPIQIEAKGEIMMPIEVISVDARELLRQSLFG